MNRTRAFTLIELLVVISIIALLIGILLPALASARLTAQKVAAAVNQRTVLQGNSIYETDSDGELPAGHAGIQSGPVYAITWITQIRDALGGPDSGFMESVINPAAGKDFDVAWELNRDSSARFHARPDHPWYSDQFGYTEDEILVVGGFFNILDKETEGQNAFSIGWNESGVAPVGGSREGEYENEARYKHGKNLGLGEHAFPADAYAIRAESVQNDLGGRARSEDGPRVSEIADPGNMIAVADSLVDLRDDAWVTPRRGSQFEQSWPGAYGTDKANFGFMDGHVEGLRVEDYVLTEEVVEGLESEDPTVFSRIRRWNNTGKPEAETALAN